MKKLVLILSLAMLSVSILSAAPKNKNEFQRSSTGVFDVQQNTKSNVDFFSTNYGIFGLDIANMKGGCFWPRGSQNQYIFAGGFWFGLQKNVDGNMKKLTSLSYNPNSGRSWYVPGNINDGNEAIDDTKKYRVYYSTDFNRENGTAINQDDGPNWPLWITDNSKQVEYGVYKHDFIYNVEDRNLNTYPMGPMIHSDEHIYSTYKDTDINMYEGGTAKRTEDGYPLQLQFEENTHTWETGDMKDVIIMTYSITNNSEDTYEDCWFAPVIDFDIALKTSSTLGAGNDRINYYMEDDELNLVYAWTEGDLGEEGQGFGYIGFSMLESPAVDENRNIRHDKLIFEPSEQLGLSTFRNWPIHEDKLTDEDRYNFLSSGVVDGDTGPGDKRLMMATGPFNLKPGETARLAIGISFAMPAKGGEADGTLEDITGLQSGKIKNKLQATGSSLIGKQETMKEEYYTVLYNSVNDFKDLDDDAVYPNPANNWINARYTNEVGGNVRISLVNMSGNEVAELANGYVAAGEQVENFILNDINVGMYILKIETPKGVYAKKLLISK